MWSSSSALCIYTVTLRHSLCPRVALSRAIFISPFGFLGWLAQQLLPHMFGIVAIFFALGHSVLAMRRRRITGAGSNREIAAP